MTQPTVNGAGVQFDSTPLRPSIAAAPKTHDDRQNLITDNLGLAVYLAKQFAFRGEQLEDLVQVSSLALINAADRFDPSHECQFATFASRTIIGELKHYFRDKGWSVRPPRNLQEMHAELNVLIADLSQQLGRSPSSAELAEASGYSLDDVLGTIEAGHAYRAVSLDIPSLEGGTFGDNLPGSDGQTDAIDERCDLATNLAHLDERSRKMLNMRFVDECTQSQIATELGVSQMQVSRLLHDALQNLRKTYVH